MPSSANDRPKQDRRAPLRRGFPFRVVRATLLLAFAASMIGCGSSSPRFHSTTSDGTSPEPKRTNGGQRFSSREAEEETKENDRKPAPEEIEKITGGKRSFRTEKNEALKPLETSKLMREISRYMGVRYVHGGTSMEGMDCSGYTMTVFRDGVSISLPRSASAQAEMGTAVERNELKFGDLVFFNTTGTPASHVGIYVGDDLFAHASVTLGVTISSLESSYYNKRYEGARRIIH